ncbi:hypothetical protein [Pseudobutyrivibrio sp.]|uniref:hypothetical protein n=1 Tax=Pseudobutyrivibrio sp. TaxID=2014367 RepID=UPI001D872A6D|nr:hypothetical protein [Pseudobutyrivibrio sp.]MBE5912365.1 hypothetical protein [Pseudobutyrivibrio sp.]
MKGIRIVGFSIESAMKKNNVDATVIREKFGFSDVEFQQVLKGRKMLTFPQLSKIADYIGVSVKALLKEDNREYDENVVHCMTGFTKGENRENILNDIYDYMDLYDEVLK